MTTSGYSPWSSNTNTRRGMSDGSTPVLRSNTPRDEDHCPCRQCELIRMLKEACSTQGISQATSDDDSWWRYDPAHGWVRADGDGGKQLRIGTYYCCQKAAGTGATVCPDCAATVIPLAARTPIGRFDAGRYPLTDGRGQIIPSIQCDCANAQIPQGDCRYPDCQTFGTTK